MRNKIEDLRNHLFETIEGLLDKTNPLEIERAKAVSDVAQTIINSAKVEVDLLRAMGAEHRGTGFIPVDAPDAGGKRQPRLVAGSKP